MGVSLDLRKAHAHHRYGEIMAVFTWVNDERALVLMPAFRPGAPWFIVCESAAWKWDPDGETLLDRRGQPVTGTAADGLAISNIAGASGTFTAAASVASEANGYGNEQLVEVTAAAAGDGVKVRAESSTGSTSFVADLIAGRTYCMECQLRVASTDWPNTAIDEIDFSMLVTMDSIERRVSAIEIYDAITNASVAEDMTLHLRTQNMTIPVGASVTVATWELRVRHKGPVSGDTFTFGMSRIAIWDVTDCSNQ